MPGAKCPKCENLTLFKNPTGKWCTTKDVDLLQLSLQIMAQEAG